MLPPIILFPTCSVCFVCCWKIYCDTVMTFLSLSWKCYWHSNDLLHVPVDSRAICQHFISLSINLSPASQTFPGMKFKQIQYIALIQLLFSVGASQQTHAGQERAFYDPCCLCFHRAGVVSVCGAGDDFCLSIWNSLCWEFCFLFVKLSWSGQVPSYFCGICLWIPTQSL